ncbi:MAG: hypothetical protein JXR03_04945 [Cyclobacteriaceae bacterium]
MRRVFFVLIVLLPIYCFSQEVVIIPKGDKNIVKVLDASLLASGTFRYRLAGGGSYNEIDISDPTSYDLMEDEAYEFEYEQSDGSNVVFQANSYSILENNSDNGNRLNLSASSRFQINEFDAKISIDLGKIWKTQEFFYLIVKSSFGFEITRLAIKNDLKPFLSFDLNPWIDLFIEGEVYEIEVKVDKGKLGTLYASKESIEDDIQVSLESTEIVVDCDNNTSHIIYEGLVSESSFPLEIVWNLYDINNPNLKLVEPVTQQLTSVTNIAALEVQRDGFYYIEICAFDACHRVGYAKYLVQCTENDNTTSLMIEPSNLENHSSNNGAASGSNE